MHEAYRDLTRTSSSVKIVTSDGRVVVYRGRRFPPCVFRRDNNPPVTNASGLSNLVAPRMVGAYLWHRYLFCRLNTNSTQQYTRESSVNQRFDLLSFLSQA